MGRLGDRFVLVRELGPGGMSRVFLGRDEVLDRPVAVKILRPDPEDPEVGLRFRREGRAAARLSHPNIVRVYDAGENEFEGDRVSYIVMEYVPGGGPPLAPEPEARFGVFWIGFYNLDGDGTVENLVAA